MYNRTGPMPVKIGDLVRLRALRLDHNKLSGFKLRVLKIRFAIKVTFPSTVGDEGDIPLEFGRMDHLECLHLKANSWKGKVPLFKVRV
jgi:hypothetical protein